MMKLTRLQRRFWFGIGYAIATLVILGFLWGASSSHWTSDGRGAMARTVRRGRPIRMVARSRTKAGALAKASAFADKIASNPLLAAALPPGTGQAIKVISALSRSAAAGKLEKVSKKLVGKGARRLKKALKKFR